MIDDVTPQQKGNIVTKEQIKEAVAQMRSHCQLLEETSDYHGVSARGVLYELGYGADDADEVIRALADGGFAYCLDPMIEATHFDPNNARAVDGMVTDRPSADACYWGPDQLRSRLDAASIR